MNYRILDFCHVDTSIVTSVLKIIMRRETMGTLCPVHSVERWLLYMKVLWTIYPLFSLWTSWKKWWWRKMEWRRINHRNMEVLSALQRIVINSVLNTVSNSNISVNNVIMIIANLESPRRIKLFQRVKMRHSPSLRYPLTHHVTATSIMWWICTALHVTCLYVLLVLKVTIEVMSVMTLRNRQKCVRLN